jgi:hypothetical protein
MMKTLMLLLMASLVSCLNSFTLERAAFADDVSAEQVKKQAEETLDTAKKFTMQQKEEFQKKMEAELKDLSKLLDEYKQKAEAKKGEALTALQGKMEELKVRQKDAEERVNELKSSTSRAWDETKDKTEQAVGELKKAYEALGKLFK